MTTTEQQYYSVRQIAEMLGLHPKTIYERIAEGKIAIIRSNGDTGRIRINKTEYNRFVTQELSAK